MLPSLLLIILMVYIKMIVTTLTPDYLYILRVSSGVIFFYCFVFTNKFTISQNNIKD